MEPSKKHSQSIKTHPKSSDKKHAWPEIPESNSFKTLEILLSKSNSSNNNWPASPTSLLNKTWPSRLSIKMPFSLKETIRRKTLLFSCRSTLGESFWVNTPCKTNNKKSLSKYAHSLKNGPFSPHTLCYQNLPNKLTFWMKWKKPYLKKLEKEEVDKNYSLYKRSKKCLRKCTIKKGEKCKTWRRAS